MSLEKLYAIKAIARQSRAYAEGLVQEYGYPSDLCGLCAIASRDLWRRLHSRGFVAKIAHHPHHCFVIIPDLDILVDVTATQFGKKPVEIRKQERVWHWFWNVSDTDSFFDNEDDFLSALKSKRLGKWCECEITPQSCRKNTCQ